MNNEIKSRKIFESLSSIITEQSIRNDVLEELKRASLETTGHGLPRIILAQRAYLKILWLIFLILSMSLCVFMIYRSISQYVDFGVTSQISRVNQAEMTFPAISICNVNPLISKSGSYYVQSFYETKYNITLNYYSDLSDLIFNGKIEYETDWLIYQTYHPDFPDETRSNFGFYVKQMLSYCETTNFKCRRDDFERYYDPIYGNCFKFNGNASKPLYKIRQEGHGFYIEIFMGISDDDKFITLFHQLKSRGAVIIIDDQKAFPIKKQGIMLAPGDFVKMILSKTSSKTLPFPYGDCQDAEKVNYS